MSQPNLFLYQCPHKGLSLFMEQWARGEVCQVEEGAGEGPGDPTQKYHNSGNSTGLGISRPGFNSCTRHFLTVWPWVSQSVDLYNELHNNGHTD